MRHKDRTMSIERLRQRRRRRVVNEATRWRRRRCTHPQHDDPGVPPVGAAAAAADPRLAGQQEDGHDRAIRDEPAPLHVEPLFKTRRNPERRPGRTMM